MANISLDQIEKRYDEFVAVENFNLSVASGEFVVFLGPSGCGKTTTLRIIAGFVQPSRGTIAIADRVVNRLPPRARGIGMVFQDYALFPGMTVRENIAFGLVEHRASRARIRERVDEMLRLIRMEPFADRLPSALSGGQQQRVALARALAYEPAVLLMDEPLGALDQKLREEMQREFAGIQRQLGTTTLFVTHDQHEAMAMADRIVVMRNGRAEQIGTPDDVYERPASHFAATFVGRSNQLPGRVITRSDDGMVTVALDAGGDVRARACAAGLEVGTKAVCVVRPEKVRVANGEAAGELENSLPVIVARRSYLGSTVDFVCKHMSGREVIVQMTPGEAGSIIGDDMVELRFGASNVFCFPAEA